MICRRDSLLTAQQGEQLRRDLNIIVGAGNNWKIPFCWGVLLRYVNGPLLGIVFSFCYPKFASIGSRNPTHIYGFVVAHIALVIVALGLIVPRWFDVLVPVERREDGDKFFAPNVTLALEGADSDSMEAGEGKLSANTNYPEGKHQSKTGEVPRS
jgi:solute carrier family 6 (neurotransmitter transporter, GABA) member 1